MIQINYWELAQRILSTLWKLWPFWLLVLAIIIFKIFIIWINKFFIRQKSMTKKGGPTDEVKKLGKMLENYGWKIELEKFDGYKHIDIAIPEVKVDIEVDGKHHNLNRKQALADLKRTYYSFKKGYLTLRIPNVLVRDEETVETTAIFIDKFLKEAELK